MAYQLKTLDEVERYVSEHGHLPGISREASGLFERQDMVLEKIEELFIYLFEMNARMKELESDGPR